MDPKELRARRTKLIEEMNALVEAAKAENRELTDEERTTLATNDVAVGKLDEDIAIAERMEARDREQALAAPSGAGAGIQVGAEEPVYRPDGRQRFLVDAYMAEFRHDRDALERIERNNAQGADAWYRDHPEYRDVGTGAFTGLVVPQYLTDLVAPLARAGRQFADRVRKRPLPPTGMTLNISRISTGTAVLSQATENAAVQETDADDTLLTVNVRTIAGAQDLSRQLLDRGEGADDVVVEDLILAYHTELDRTILVADGTLGTHLGVASTTGIGAVTYTDASPTVGELYPKIADAIQRINAGVFFRGDLIVMAPRRWGWITAAVDTAGRPLAVPGVSAPQNAIGIVDAPGDYGAVGSIQGLPVVTDGNVPINLGVGTNEDEIFVVASQQAILWEAPGMPLQLRFEQTLGGNLTVKVVVFGYSAFTAGRYPAASSLISGTGLVTPTF